MEKSLIIWTKNGQTLKFEKVYYLKEDDRTLSFQYHGVSTNTTREARFNLVEVLGFAITANT